MLLSSSEDCVWFSQVGENQLNIATLDKGRIDVDEKFPEKKAQAPFSVRFLGLLLLNLICRPCGLFAKTAQGIPVFLCRVKLRAMLEWSSLYRVALLLSKINDDSDLGAEAAILYGKVGVQLFSKSSKRCEVISTEWVVQWQLTAWDQVQFCSCVAWGCNLKALVWHWQACNRMNFNTESLVAYTSRAAFVGLSWVKRLGSLWFCFLKYPPRLCQKTPNKSDAKRDTKLKLVATKSRLGHLSFPSLRAVSFFRCEFLLDRCNIFCVLIGFCD